MGTSPRRFRSGKSPRLVTTGIYVDACVTSTHREPTRNRSAAADSRLSSLVRDSQVRGARGARVERINLLAQRPTTLRQFQRTQPRWRARPPSCRTFVWKKAGMG